MRHSFSVGEYVNLAAATSSQKPTTKDYDNTESFSEIKQRTESYDHALM
jgi:hypothetical protein